MVKKSRLYLLMGTLACVWHSYGMASPQHYTVASSNNFPPVNLIDANGQLAGFGKDLSTAVADVMGITLSYKHSADWTEVTRWLDAGEADIIHDTGYTPERDQYLDFSKPIIEMPEVIIVKKGRVDITELDSLYDKKVACVNQHISHQYLKQFPRIQCQVVQTPAQALADLVAGSVDALVYPQQIARYLAFQLQLEDKVDYINRPLRILSWSMTVKEGNKELIQLINEGLDRVRNNGEYERIYNKWFGNRVLDGYTRRQAWLMITSAVFLVLMIVGIPGIWWNYKRLQHAQFQLVQSEIKFKALIEHMPQAVYLKNTQLEYVSVNSVFARKMGMDETQIIGNTDQNLQPQLAHENHESDISVLNKQETQQYEQSNGDSWKQIIKIPMYNSDQDLEGILGITWDITQQKHSASILEQQNILLETIFDNLPDAIILCNDELHIVMANPPAEKMFGLSKSEFQDLSLEEICNPREKDSLRFSGDNGDTLSHLQIEFRRSDGSTFSGEMVVVKTQLLVAYSNILVIRDISEQIHSESYLQRLNRTLTTVIETRHVIIRSTNEKELLHGVCQVLIITGGYRFVWVGIAKNNESKSVQPLVHAGFENGYLDTIKVSWADCPDGRGPTGTAIRSGKTCVAENLYQTGKESPSIKLALQNGYASCVALPLYKGGKLLGVFNIYADKPYAFDAEELSLLEELMDDVSFGISAQSAKNELDQAVQQRANVLDSVTDIVYQIDTDSKLVMWNKQFNLVSGCSDEELQSKYVLDFFSDEEKLNITHAIEKCYTSGTAETECTFVSKDKTKIPYHFTGSLTKDENQNVIGITGVGRNLQGAKLAEQEKIHLQNQLQHAQKMESIGQLTGGIAHDFNNILASIMGYTTLVLDNITEKSDEKLNGYLQQVIKASERARDLVKQMLAFSRGSETELTLLSLHPLVQESINMLQSTLASTIEIKYTPQRNLPEIMADSVQLNQIILNLCINARDAMNYKGTISIETKTTVLPESECSSCHHVFSGKFVELSIHDTGKGLKPELLSKIFEPFFTTKEIGKGSGMGLAMVHGIVHKHNGHILADSRLNAGTTFRLLLPIGDELPQVNEANISEKMASDSDKKHILVVDDEAPVALFEGELLKGVGYNVSVFTNSREAFNFFKESPDQFDLVVTDQTMPDLTGGEMASAMLKIRPNLPIVLCTGFSNALSPQQAANIGIMAYFHKPLNKDALLKKIRELVP